MKFYAACLGLALDYFHRQHIVYRDLKPENILIKLNGYPCLTDFGLQRLMKLRKEKNSNSVGTSEYLAPEVILGKE